MWPHALLALVWIIEAAWVVSYLLKNGRWKRVISEAEARAGGPVALDPRTLMAIHDVRQLNRDEFWFDAYLLYHLPACALARLAIGRFHVFHPRGQMVVTPISIATVVVYSMLVLWLS